MKAKPPDDSSNTTPYRYYKGEDKPIPNMSVQPPDKWYYDRWKAAKRLDMKVWQIEDDPDDDRYNLREKENEDG